MIRRQDAGLFEDREARRRIEPTDRGGVRDRRQHTPIGLEPGLGDRAKPGIVRPHPSLLDLKQELDDGIRIGERIDGLVDRHIEQAPGPRGSPQLPHGPDAGEPA